MSMSKQDFEALAEMCADDAHEDLLCDATINLLAAFCKSQNNKFDDNRFHHRIASLKAKRKLQQRMAMKGVNKEWFIDAIPALLINTSIFPYSAFICLVIVFTDFSSEISTSK